MRFVRRRRRRDEGGAIAILVATLLGTGVLFGLVALVFDFGMVNWNHSQLQSSADAAALKAAKICATDPAGCPPASAVEGIARANDDGSRHSSHVDICGNKAPLPACGANDATRITSCPDVLSRLPHGANYVKARAQKDTDFTFGGDGKAEGQACAAVAWGNPASVGGVLPVTIPQCDFAAIVAATGYTRTADIAIAIDAQQSDCPGSHLPGGKGWLVGDCSSVTATIGGSNPGAGKAPDCLGSLIGEIVYLPIYDTVADQGADGTFHIYGVAGFHLSGVKAPSYSGPRGNNSTPGCPKDGYNLGPHGPNNGNSCIWGYFVKAVAPIGTIDPSGGGPDTGLKIIQTIG